VSPDGLGQAQAGRARRIEALVSIVCAACTDRQRLTKWYGGHGPVISMRRPCVSIEAASRAACFFQCARRCVFTRNEAPVTYGRPLAGGGNLSSRVFEASRESAFSTPFTSLTMARGGAGASVRSRFFTSR